jgi:hypothetical protein
MEEQILAELLVVLSLQQAMIMMLLLMNMVCTKHYLFQKWCFLILDIVYLSSGLNLYELVRAFYALWKYQEKVATVMNFT